MLVAGWSILARCQRRIALRVATAYRTISGEALLVLAGVPPIDLLATERTAVYEGRLRDGDTTELRTQAKRAVIESWQERWRTSTKGEWIRRLIPDLGP